MSTTLCSCLGSPPPRPHAVDLGWGRRKRPQQVPGKSNGHARSRPGLTSAAKRVLAERAGRRPQKGQGGPDERAGGRAAGSHPGRPRRRLGPRTCHPSRQLWRQRCACGHGLGDGTWARPGVRERSSPSSLDCRGSDFHNRGPGSSGRAQFAMGRALFLARAALPVGQTEPVNLAAGEGPAPRAPRNGSRSSVES